MAYELKTIFTVKDNASAAIRNMMRQVQSLDRVINQLNNRANQFGSNMNRNNSTINNANRTIVHNTTVINNNTNTVNNNTNTINRNINTRNTMINTLGRESGALQGLGASLVSVAGLYAAAQGASKAFQATIGAAAQYEQSEVAVKAIFNDDKASKAYLAMVDKMAIDSPLLNSGEMLKSSKTLTAMTKNVGDLGKAWSIIERLMVLDPTQGTDGAAFALKEMWQGDALSMVERFGLSKKDLNWIKKLDIPEQIAEIDKLLNGMGITQKTVNAMGSTTLGYWAQIQERSDKFLRTIGASSNTKLGKVLGDIVTTLDTVDTDSMAKRFGDALGDVVEKVINVGKWMWKWREPIAWAVGALAAVGSAFVGFGIIAALANPISLIAAGIAGAAVGMKALYDNSETFRGIIDGIIGKAKELWDVFKADGVGGIVDMLFGAGTFEAVAAKFNEIKTFITTKIAEMQPGFERLKGVFSSVWSTISSVFSTVWNGVLKPGLENFWAALQILGSVVTIVFNNVIAPGLQFAATLFSTLWSVAGPVLSLLGAALSAAFAVLKFVWDTILTPLVAFITGGVKSAFDMFTEAVNIVGGAFDWVGGIIDTVADKISGFVDAIKNVKLPDWVTNGVSATVKWVGGAIDKFDAAVSGSHYNGLGRVPYNGYIAELHKGERVLTSFEADQYDNTMRGVAGVSYEQSSAGIRSKQNGATANYYAPQAEQSASTQGTGARSISIAKVAEQIIVREDADIDRILDGIVAKLIEAEAAGV